RAVRGTATARAGAHAARAAVRGGGARVRDANVAADGVGAAAASVGDAPRAVHAAPGECGRTRGGAVLSRRRDRPARALARHSDRRRARQGGVVAAPPAGAVHHARPDRALAQRAGRGPPARARPARLARPRAGERAMIGFTARRIGAALLTAWVASIIAFVLFWTVPNVDPSYFLGGA